MNAVLTSLLALILFAFSLTPAQGAGDDKTAAAIRAAETFLLLLDTGQYGQSWDEAAALFRKQVPKESWIQQLSGLLPPLGPVRNRTITSARYTTRLPGAPDGEYVVIQYRSSFANKKEAVETVTPMLDKDGQWRISGYYLK